MRGFVDCAARKGRGRKGEGDDAGYRVRSCLIPACFGVCALANANKSFMKSLITNPIYHSVYVSPFPPPWYLACDTLQLNLVNDGSGTSEQLEFYCPGDAVAGRRHRITKLSVSMSQNLNKFIFRVARGQRRGGGRESVANIGNLICRYKLDFHVTNRNKKFNRIQEKKSVGNQITGDRHNMRARLYLPMNFNFFCFVNIFLGYEN